MTAGSSCRGRETCYGEDGTGAYSERASTHPMQTAHSRLMHSSRRLLTVIASHHKQAAAPEWRHRGRMLIARQRLALRPLRHLSPRRQRRELRSGAQHFRSCWGQEGGPAARGGVRRASALEDMTAPSHFPLTRRRAEAPLPPVEREHTGRTWRRLSVPCPLLLHGQHFEQHGVPVGLLLLHTSHVQPHRLHAVHLPEVPPALPLGDVLRTAPAPAPGFRSLAGPEAGLLLEGVEQELSLLGKGLAWGQPTRWMQRTDIPLVRAGVEHEGPGPGLVWTRRSMPAEASPAFILM